MPSPRFKKLFDELCRNAMAQGVNQSLTQTREDPGLYNRLAEMCHVSYDTVISWKTKGRIPADPNQVALLGEFGMEEAGLSYQWLEAFLREGNCFATDLLNRYQVKETTQWPARTRHNLPPSRFFVNRAAEVARILEGFEYAYPVTIEGFGGVGKSTLAIWVAERCLSDDDHLISTPFESVIWISAKDYPPRYDLTLNQLLDAIAERTGFTGLRELPLERKKPGVNEILQSSRLLLVVDNMETVKSHEVYDFLIRVPRLSSRPTSQVIITTRHRQYRSIWPVEVAGLPDEAALKKIRHDIKVKDLHSLFRASDQELRPLAQVTQGNPKAIELILGYIRRTGVSLAEAIDDLEGPAHEYEELFDYLFKIHWRALDEPAQNVLLSLSFFAGAATRAALRKTAGLNKTAFKRPTGLLIEMSLMDVEYAGSGDRPRYTLHPLTRTFARNILKERKAWEYQAQSRFAAYWLGVTRTNGARFREARYAEWARERKNISMSIDWSFKHEQWPRVIDFVNNLRPFWEAQGPYRNAVDHCEQAYGAAQKLNDEATMAELARFGVGWFSYCAGNFGLAKEYCRRSLLLFQEANHDEGIVACRRLLGKIALERADQLRRGWDNGQASTTGEQATYLDLLTEADTEFHCALNSLEESRMSLQKGYLLADLGQLAHQRGDLQEAISWYQDALKIHESLASIGGLLSVLDDYVLALIQTEEIGLARKHMHRLTEFAKEHNRKRHVAHSLRLAGLMNELEGNLGAALDHLLEARKIYKIIGAQKWLEVIEVAIERVSGSQDLLKSRNIT